MIGSAAVALKGETSPLPPPHPLASREATGADRRETDGCGGPRSAIISDVPRRTVIVVDDHDAFRRQAGRLLQAAGWEVVGEAHDGAGAVRLTRELRPDAVLLDVGLPDASGFEVAAAIADGPAVLLVSSDEDAGELAREQEQPFLWKGALSTDALAEAFGPA
jgi:two-component system response regulator EvgA